MFFYSSLLMWYILLFGILLLKCPWIGRWVIPKWASEFAVLKAASECLHISLSESDLDLSWCHGVYYSSFSRGMEPMRDDGLLVSFKLVTTANSHLRNWEPRNSLTLEASIVWSPKSGWVFPPSIKALKTHLQIRLPYSCDLRQADTEIYHNPAFWHQSDHSLIEQTGAFSSFVMHWKTCDLEQEWSLLFPHHWSMHGSLQTFYSGLSNVATTCPMQLLAIWNQLNLWVLSLTYFNQFRCK